jgi:hypothetical protein
LFTICLVVEHDHGINYAFPLRNLVCIKHPLFIPQEAFSPSLSSISITQPVATHPHTSIKMLSKIFFGLAAATAAFAAPGEAGGSWDNGADCYTTCSTELCSQSTVYQKTVPYYETNTQYQPVTKYVPSVYQYTQTLTSSSKVYKTTSTAYTTVIYKPYTYETWEAVPYTSVCAETKTVPVVTSTPYASVCTEYSTFPYTSAWVETSTYCSTVTPAPTSYYNKGW